MLRSHEEWLFHVYNLPQHEDRHTYAFARLRNSNPIMIDEKHSPKIISTSFTHPLSSGILRCRGNVKDLLRPFQDMAFIQIHFALHKQNTPLRHGSLILLHCSSCCLLPPLDCLLSTYLRKKLNSKTEDTFLAKFHSENSTLPTKIANGLIVFSGKKLSPLCKSKLIFFDRKILFQLIINSYAFAIQFPSQRFHFRKTHVQRKRTSPG